MSIAAQVKWGFHVVTGSLGLSLVAWAVRAEGVPPPVAHWAFEAVHERAVTDAVGRLTGAVQGRPKSVPGVDGQALKFDGDCVSVAPSPTLRFADATFSVSVWVNPYALGRGQQMIIAKNIYSAGQREWGLMIDKDNRFRFYLWQSGWKTVGSQTEPRPGHWQHVAVTVEKGHGRLYVNRKLQGEGPLAPSVSPTDAPLTIGGVQDGGRVMQTFLGALDEVSLFREVLTPAAIQTLADKQTTPNQTLLSLLVRRCDLSRPAARKRAPRFGFRRVTPKCRGLVRGLGE